MCLGGRRKAISLSVWFYRSPGHTLHDPWTAGIPFLRSYRVEENLKREILQRVTADVPGLLSVDLLDLMPELATRDSPGLADAISFSQLSGSRSTRPA